MIVSAFLAAPAAFVPAASPIARAHFSASTEAALGQTVRLGNARVTPSSIVEDSRCPRMVSCVWRGRLRITASIDGRRKVTLDDGKPLLIDGGKLTLIGAVPVSQRGEKIDASSYRFLLRFER